MLYKTWFDFFHNTFIKIEKKLNIILGASRCREGWLQGEFYRLAGDMNLNVNVKIDDLGFVDLYGNLPYPMLAELKILGGSYYTKNIYGRSNIDTFIKRSQNGIFYISKNDIKNTITGKGSHNSLLRDYIRLSKASNKFEKYIILVIPKEENETDLGSVLDTIELSRKSRHRNYSGFKVKIWKL